MQILTKFKKNIINIPGWKTKRKIVVFESDDWGAIRMPNKKTYNESNNNGLNPDKSPYTRFDTLANADDLNLLFSLLKKFKDKFGNHPVFTANVVVCNPDFKKIKESNYNTYFYESFLNTLDNYYPNEKIFDIWKNGINEKLFTPQFHGREHVNANQWLIALRNNNPFLKQAFDLNYWGIPEFLYKNETKLNLQATYDALNLSEIKFHKNSIKEGLEVFEQIFGYKSETFIPNNFIFDKEIIKNTLRDAGVHGLQGMKHHKQPFYDSPKRITKRRYLGLEEGMVNLVRNVYFEPSQEISKSNVVEKCIKGIENAFYWNKPAIISAHRLNFISSINIKNRDENLKLLEEVFLRIQSKWDDIEFMDSAKLSRIIWDKE